MKQTILTIALTTFALFTFAQGPQLGVQASPLFSVLSYDGESMNGLGFSTGLSVKFPLGEHWSVRPEINFQQRSFSSEYEEDYSSGDYNYSSKAKYRTKISFIDVPVLFEYRTNSRLGFYVGPQVGADIGSKYLIEYESMEKDLTTGEVFKSEGTEEVKSTDQSMQEISLALGTNYNLDNGLSFEFRFQRSIGLIDAGDFETDISMANVQLGMRYLLPVGKKK
jgi:hypothetical protein